MKGITTWIWILCVAGLLAFGFGFGSSCHPSFATVPILGDIKLPGSSWTYTPHHDGLYYRFHASLKSELESLVLDLEELQHRTELFKRGTVDLDETRIYHDFFKNTANLTTRLSAILASKSAGDSLVDVDAADSVTSGRSKRWAICAHSPDWLGSGSRLWCVAVGEASSCAGCGS